MRSIIWDWNGTLLNDLDFCISTINVLLKKRELNLLNRDSYKDVFGFPVKDYYEEIGFDFSKEDFDIPAQEFIKLYNAGLPYCKLFNAATQALDYFNRLGFQQFVLSAMKQTTLEETLKQQNIYNYFKGVAGLNDIYAVSKVERGEQLIQQFNIDKSQSIIFGDTNHDFEVAQQLEIKCVLIADGHQSKNRLKATGARVINDLNEIETVTF